MYISPFKTIVSTDTYIVNGGKVINYNNPANFTFVKKDRDSASIPKIQNNLSEDFIYYLDPDVVKIEVYLMASFVAPAYWVPGEVFVPKINNAWILRREQYSDLTYSIIGQKENSSSNEIRFDSISSLKNGYACVLGLISVIKKTETGYDVFQIQKNDYIFSRFFDSAAYACHNTELPVSLEDILTSELELQAPLIKSYKRGYIDSCNSSLNGIDNELGSQELQTFENDIFRENQRI